MKISSQEEYGLRILVRMAQHPGAEGLTIPQLAEDEGLSQHYVAKLCRILRLAGLINSSRGKEGGYSLARPAAQISLISVLEALGGKLYKPEFCRDHAGLLKNCSNAVECSVRSLWQLIQEAVDGALQNLTLQDMIGPDNKLNKKLFQLIGERNSFPVFGN